MRHDEGIPSKAAIARHPIHPMLIPFPIACLVVAFVCDAVFWASGDAFWARAAFFLVAAGLVTGVLAAVFGLVDFIGIRQARAHRAGWIHFVGNAAVLALAAANLAFRAGERVDAVVPGGILLSAVTTLLLVVTGWYGGELSYRHRIGVMRSADAISETISAGRTERFPAGPHPTGPGPTPPQPAGPSPG